MARQVLKLSTLTGLDLGKVDAAFQIELQKVVKDCMDRPGDESKRSVTLTLEIAPEMASAGVCETVAAEFQVTSKMPSRKSRVYSMRPHVNGSLLFNPESADDANQGTLDEIDPETGEAR